MKTKRPVYLNLLTMRFPVTAVVSILHRISGFILFLCIPFILWAFESSLHSIISYTKWVNITHVPWVKWTLALMALALIYHIIAGLRHMLMDCGVAEGILAATLTSYAVFLLTIASGIGLGVVLW